MTAEAEARQGGLVPASALASPEALAQFVASTAIEAGTTDAAAPKNLGHHVTRLSGYVPREPGGKVARLRSRLPWRRKEHGLAAIPERYRLEFMRLSASQLPLGTDGALIRGLADRLADGVTVPRNLAKQSDPRQLDAWFRSRALRIKILAAKLGAEQRASL